MQDKLFVVTAVSNTQRFSSRYRLYNQFKQYMTQFPRVELYTVELAFGHRPFAVTDPNDPRNVQIRGTQEFFHKENLMNIGISKLPPEAKYIAWIDADCSFLDPNWVGETVHYLQHYQFLQLFAQINYLDYKNNVIGQGPGFIAAQETGTKEILDRSYNGTLGATGLAWAARREALDDVGTLLDWCIIGSGDWHMAYCLIGRGIDVSFDWHSVGYRILLKKYQNYCDKYIKKNVGYLPGCAVHYWHGPTNNRGYDWRWKILKDYHFDPIKDLKKDCQGLYIIDPDKYEMIYELRNYFRSRKEDHPE